MGTLGAVGGVALVYFLAARLGLALLSAPSDIAVFWPASGIAAGFMILANRRLRPGILVGVIIGTITANVLSDRTLWTSLLKSLCNGSEALLVAGLIERWFGRPFAFVNLPRVLGFVAGTVLAAGASATGGAAIMIQFHAVAPFWDAWRAWFLSDWVGIVMVAPLVVGLGQVRRKTPARAELIEAVGVLSIMALIAWYAVTYETGSWLSFDAGAVVLPFLLWLVARCEPVFGIAGAFVVSLTVVYATTFGIGHLGDATVPTAQRVGGAQVVITTVTLYTLVLAALFAQRKEVEEELRNSEQREAKKSAALARLHEISSRLWVKRDLRAALDEILAGAIKLLDADMGAIRIWDGAQATLRLETHRGFKPECLDLFRHVPAVASSACERALRSGERMVIENVEEDADFAPFRPLARAAGYQAMQSTPILSREGAPLGMLATHFRSVHKPSDQDLHLLDLYVRQAADIIEHHKADETLRRSEERLRLAQLSTGIGVWDWDVRSGKVTWTRELEALFGLEPGTVKSYADFRAHVHPDDIQRVETEREAAIRRRETFRIEFRIIRSDGAIRWISATGGAFYDQATDRPVRVLGNNLDITERKLAELALAERNTQLELASITARVGSFVIDIPSGLVTLSPGCTSILGLPESTIETSREDVRKLVHPDDLAQFDAERDQAFLGKKREFIAQFRIIRADDDEVRWIEGRSVIFYDRGGQPLRLVALIIDFTDRKMAEQTLTERTAQLALAGRAAKVGSYSYDVNEEVMQVSEGYAAIHGLPAETTETTLSEWRSRVHPEDLRRVEDFRDQMFANRIKEYNIEYRIVHSDGELRWVERRSSISYDGDGRPTRVVGVSIDVTERRLVEERQRVLLAELDHRVKNSLATVSSMVYQTAVGSTSVPKFVKALDGRFRSMATTHELLSSGRWRGISLPELIRQELAPYATRHNTKINGPEVVLRPEAGQAMAMVLHELATNAAKHGALSTEQGRVSIRWERRLNGHPLRLVLDWHEVGGPPVVDPDKASFGMSTIRDLIPYEFGGKVDLTFAREGVRCRVELPADWFSNDYDGSLQRASHAGA